MSETAKNSCVEYFKTFPPYAPGDFPIFGNVPVGRFTLDRLSRKLCQRGMSIKRVNQMLQGVRPTREAKIINLVCVQPIDFGFLNGVPYKTLLKCASTSGLVLCPRETAFQVFISEDTCGVPKKYFDFKERQSKDMRAQPPVFLFASDPVDIATLSTAKGRIEKRESHIFGICVAQGVMKLCVAHVASQHELSPDAFILFQKVSTLSPRGGG